MTTHRILQGGYFNDTLRAWQSRTTEINPNCLIYPVFVCQDPDSLTEIKSLPGQYRVGVNRLKDYLKPVVDNGLKTVLLFGIMEDQFKSPSGDSIVTQVNPAINAVKELRKTFPDLTIACDVCLCGYTSHGHCGVLDVEGVIDNTKTITILKEAAYAYVKAGCHIVAPSDMADGRVKAISDMLKKNNKRNQVSIMSYSAKFASCFYGPFRDAVGSAPAFGDRRNYQLPPGADGLANRAVKRDIEEEADILMVKPGMPYLDIVKEIKTKNPEYPLAVYQVSGEYAMLYHASENGAIDRKKAVFESLVCMHRAGADIVISYFTPNILQWLKEK